MLDALGMPSLVLLASMTGFGSLARDAGLDLGMALATTAGVWGLPGQIALAELYAAGAGAFAVVLAVALANARFLPMAVSFVPLLRQSAGRRRGWLYLWVQLMSINSWAAGLRRFPDMPPRLRLHYFVPFACVCMAAALIGTTAGFFVLGSVPRPVALGLLFLNPMFFAVLLAALRGPGVAQALLIGAVLGPATFALAPDWSLLLTGLFGGTLAFALTGKAGAG